MPKSHTEEMIGQAPPLPMPINYGTPLPADIAPPDHIHALLAMTEHFSGSSDYALGLFKSLGPSLMASEVGIRYAAYPEARLGQLGLVPADKQELLERYGTLGGYSIDLASVEQDAPAILAAYFASLYKCLTEPSTLLNEAAKSYLTVLPVMTELRERSGQSNLAMILSVAPPVIDNPDELLADSGLQKHEALDIIAEARDSAFAYAARLAVANAVLVGIMACQYYQGQNPYRNPLLTKDFAADIRDIMRKGSYDQYEKTRRIRALYPAGVYLVRQLVIDTHRQDFMLPDSHGNLSRALDGVDSIARRRLELSIGTRASTEPEGPAPRRTVRTPNRAAAAPAKEEPAAPQESPLAKSQDLIRRANALAENLQASASDVKRHPDLAPLSRALVKGVSAATPELTLGGMTKGEAHNILSVLVIIREFATAEYPITTLQEAIGELVRRRDALETAYDTQAAELDRRDKSKLEPFPQLRILSTFTFIDSRRPALFAALSKYELRDAATLKAWLSALFDDQCSR